MESQLRELAASVVGMLRTAGWPEQLIRKTPNFHLIETEADGKINGISQSGTRTEAA